jgi:hypothetical protein
MIDDSERGIITKEFFEFVVKNNYVFVISEIVKTEIEDSKKNKGETILKFLETLNYDFLPHSEESHNLAWNYVKDRVLTENHIDDLTHVAYATVFGCDLIVSWNRKHIVKLSKMQKINLCNVKNNYRPITICTPKEFLLFTNKETENEN